MTNMTITKKPVGINCSSTRPVVGSPLPAAPGGNPKCPGVMSRIDLSRLEEGLGHEGFECSSCHRRVKYVPARGAS